MNEEQDFSGIGIDVSDHLLDHRADNAFLEPGIGGGSGPDRAQVVGQRRERGRRHLTERCYRGGVFGDLRLNLVDLQQCPVPARFQFRRDQAITGVDRIVLSKRPVGGIVSGFEIPQQRLANLIASRDSFRFGRRCGGDGAWLDDLQQCGFNGVIHPQSAKGNAARLAVIEQSAMCQRAPKFPRKWALKIPCLAAGCGLGDQP